MAESIITLGIGATPDLEWFITSGLHAVTPDFEGAGTRNLIRPIRATQASGVRQTIKAPERPDVNAEG